MTETFSYLEYPEGGFTLKPIAVHLYVPPITWKGDPVGHIGTNDCFFFLLSGECCIRIEDDSFVLKPGQLAFLPRGKRRTYTTMNENITMYEIAFDFRIGETYWYDAMNFQKNLYCVDIEDPSAFSVYFESSLRHEYNKNIMYDVVCFSNIAEILKTYITLRHETERKTQLFTEVVRYMKENLHRQIKVEELAHVACMQDTYFIKKFKTAFGVSPINYLNKLKIYHAMTLLLTEDMSIDRIGKEIGIYDNSYFSRMFKKFCSVSPAEYRKLFKKEN